MKMQLSVISALAVASVLFASQAFAVPPVDNIGKPANSTCKPRGKTDAAGAVMPSAIQPVLHFDKIIFAVTDKLLSQTDNTEDQARLDRIPRNTELDIKVLDDPRTVADLKGKVLSFLGAQNNQQFYPAIRIIDVEYVSVICPK